MTGNKCYLDEYEDYDGGFVSFGDGKGRISRKVPRKDNIYSVNLKSVVPTGRLTCLIAKATIDESNTWHMRLGHINFKTMNKLVKGNLVKGLPSKSFENDHSCVAYQKGKQHKASYKTKLVNSINKPLHMLHMDIFGPINVKSLMKKSYCPVVTDDFTERKNRTLIEATRTMLVDSKLPTTFWAEAVNTACYVLNRVLVIKPHNKTPYELIHGRPPLIDLMKPFRCPFQQDGEARDWLDKEPPRSILTWDDLVAKFINQFFPPSKTTYYRNEIITFFQKPNETFNEAWERFKGLLRQCPHHGFSELHQLDTFYNSLNSNDQDALDSAAGGNFLDKMPQEGLAIIESKSKVRYSRSRANDSRVSTDAPLSNSSPSNNSFDIQQLAASLEDKMTIKMKQMMNEMKALVVTTPAPIKAVEEVCVTCGSNHNFNHCPLTRGGNDFPVFHDNIQQFQQTAAVGNFLQRNQPSNLASQMKPLGFNQPNIQTNQNCYQGTTSNFNQNRGTNFNQNRQNNQNQVYQAPPYQPPTNQSLVNQALPSVSQVQGVSKMDFESYAKVNDANIVDPTP
ncbi:reverse transcriptase domain-containing protein [Tanacetum coccineum]